MKIGDMNLYRYNVSSGEVHRDRADASDNIPRDSYERGNWILLKAKNEDEALKQAQRIQMTSKNFHEPDLCGHEWPSKSKE